MTKHQDLAKIVDSWCTLPETNIAPENGWLEDVFPIEIVPFQVLC